MAYEPTTDVGKALKGFTARLGLEKRSMPERMMFGSLLDQMLKEIDKDPTGAIESVKPLIIDVARALNIGPADFDAVA